MENTILERAGAIALNRIFGFRPAVARALSDNFGGSAAVFRLSGKDIRNIFKGNDSCIGKINRTALDDAVKELDWLRENGCTFISFREDGYPSLLKECPDAPVGLYMKSRAPAEEIFGHRCISIVGTRDMSPYGREWCGRIVGALSSAASPPTIVSGLAIGVDITAHLSALEHGAPTIAVLPTPINEIYPRRHTGVAGRIAAAEGCALVSDYPPGTGLQAYTFLRRNRIIAGLSDSTILVESRIKGGGMITARLASGYGREVFALPGRIDDARSGGCNMLIAGKTAEPVVSMESLARELGLLCTATGSGTDIETSVRERYAGDDTVEECVRTVRAIRDSRGITADELCRLLGLEYGWCSALCNMLENDGFIEADLLQKYYVRQK